MCKQPGIESCELIVCTVIWLATFYQVNWTETPWAHEQCLPGTCSLPHFIVAFAL